MKANEAPEKIYVHWSKHVKRLCASAAQGKDDIEYTRTDAFIEKAKEGFCKAMCQGKPPRSTCTSLGTCKEYDNFVNYMKGE